MGSNKPEKRTKKTKKRRSSELEIAPNVSSVSDQSKVGASPTEYKDRSPTIDKNEDAAAGAGVTTKKSKKARRNKKKDTVISSELQEAASKGEVEPDSEDCPRAKKGKSKKARKGKECRFSNKASKSAQEAPEMQEAKSQDVYQLSSGEDNSSQGMKKWIKEYHEKRPGLNMLQQRIDDFITSHEEQKEQARKEREAKIAEEGWTVVVHRKGGKKTADPESGVAVGSVAEAAVRDKMAKKKSKDVGLDFYRFQRREAKRNEIMQLQSKFEEDKKRIQQLRAARKFRPY